MNIKYISPRFAYTTKLIIGLVLTVYVLRKNNINAADLYNVHSLALIGILLLLQIIIFVIASYRWIIIFRSVSGQILSFRQGMIIAWIGQFFSSFLPGIISTDVSKFYYINKIYPDRKDNIHSIVTDRIVSLISLGLLIVCCFLAYLGNRMLADYFLYATLIFILFIAAASGLIKRYKIPKAAFFISFISFNLKAYSLVIAVFYLSANQNVSSVFYLSMFGQLFESVPLTPVNVGVGHFTYDLLFNLETGIVGALVYNYYFTAAFLVKLTGGLLWIIYRGNKIL